MKTIAFILIFAGLILAGGEYDTNSAQLLGGLAGVVMLCIGTSIARKRFR